MKIDLKILLILFIWGIGVQAVFASQTSITLKASASVEPGVIRLGQIAEFKGDAALIKRLFDLEVGKVAEAGRRTRITERVVKDFFVKPVLENNDIVFNGAKFCDVSARAGMVSADSVKSILLKEVRSRMPADLQEGKDWIFESQKIPVLSPPEHGGSIFVSLPPNFSGIGKDVATVQVLNGKKVIAKHSASFTIRRFEYVAELKNSVRKGETVSEGDFEMVRQETTFQKRKVLKKTNEAAGRTAIRTLRAGELLTDNALSAPYAVREGDAVKLFAQIGGTVVQTSALAQKNAFKGQVITLKNIDTGKSILATVSGQGEAWVN